MIFVIYFLLISGFSFEIGKANRLTSHAIEEIIKSGQINITGSDEHNLKFVSGKKLSQTESALVWEGTYNNTERVAIKISWHKSFYNREIAALKALNAMDTLDVTCHKIPKIFYNGKILGQYDTIAMTLFEGTLQDRYLHQKRQGLKLSDFSILMIFKQAVEALKYLGEKKVVHNDIKPENIFLRGSEVFIGDFDVSSLNGAAFWSYSELFASSSKFECKVRYAMDDLESLVYTMWYVAGFPMDPKKPEGSNLADFKKRGDAEAKAEMMRKCKYFADDDVREAMNIISADEILIKKEFPDYDRVIDALNKAINAITEKSGRKQFEWLQVAISSQCQII